MRLGRAKNPPPDAGSVWTWVAIDPDTELIPTWWVGDRSTESGDLFMEDLYSRLATRVQLTSDGHAAYIPGI